MDLLTLLATTLGVSLLAVTLVWLLSLALRDASIVDVWWGLGFALIASVTFALTADHGAAPRRGLVWIATLLWGGRLGLYLLWRNAGHDEDPRYQAMRRHWGARFPLVSLFTVFLLQGVLMWLVSLPVQVAQYASAPGALGPFDAVGALLFVVGLSFEAIGDWQLARFKADPESRGRVMDRGLWRYTRHPNYFGDSVVWWGLFCFALAVPGGWLTVLSPALMTFLLLRVSGVALLERSIGRRRPGYADYVRRTSAFFPRPPKD